MKTRESPLNQQGSGVNLEVTQWPLSSESWLRNVSLCLDQMERRRRGVPAEAELQTTSFQNSRLCLGYWGSVGDLHRTSSREIPCSMIVFHRRCCAPSGPVKALLHNRNSAVGLGRQFSCCCEMDKSGPQERWCRPPLFLMNSEAYLFNWHSMSVVFLLKNLWHCVCL